MAESISTIREDFDRIALASVEGWDHNSHYQDFLLRRVPQGCLDALEIGCGTGAFSRRLAARSERVTAIDLSPHMIRIARARSSDFANIDFRVADFLACPMPAASFDCIATIATLHHLPMAEALAKIKRALKPGGVLLVLDLFQPEGLMDVMTSALAVPVSVGLNLIKKRRLRAPRAVRKAWAEHGRNDSYLTLAEARELYAKFLPGAVVRKHLLWRYSMIWKKTVL